jgi:hypothetical protein
MLQALGGFQLLEVMGPLALPVQCQGAEADNGHTQAGQGSVADAVQASQPGGLAIHLPGRQGSLNQPQAAADRILSESVRLERALLPWGGLWNRYGDHGIGPGLRK